MGDQLIIPGSDTEARTEGEATPVYAAQFDIHARLRDMSVEYERGKELLMQLDNEQKAFNQEMNEKRQTVARGLVRMEGAMQILKEQGAAIETGMIQ